MPYTVNELLEYKYPGVVNMGYWSLKYDEHDDLVIDTWYVPGIPQPTMLEVQAFQYDADWIANRAKSLRKSAIDGFKLPEDYLSILADDLVNGTTIFQDHILNVLYTLYPLNGIPTTPPASSAVMLKRMVDTPIDKAIVIANNNTSQSITGSLKTTVSFNTESYDPASVFSSDIFTAPTAGVYEVSVFCDAANLDIGSITYAYEWQLYVTRGGSVSDSTLVDKYTHEALIASRKGLKGTLLLKLGASDTVKIEVQNTASIDLSIYNSYLNIKKVSN